jgi:23S rRNA (uridine2552-2'-O)-methyltransferase
MRPDASRDESSELYLVARNRLTAPVSEGERYELEIIDTGSEGDGVANVDGFTVFVSGVEEGTTVEVRIDDVKPNFGFATPVEEA